MRTKYFGAETVEPGFYFSFKRKELLSVDRDGVLPGTKEDVFLRVALPFMLIVGPFIGLLYVMFMPFISLAMVTVVLFRKTEYAFRKKSKRLLAGKQIQSKKNVSTTEKNEDHQKGGREAA